MNKSGFADTETMLVRQLGHLIHSGLSYDEAFQRLQDAGNGALREEIAALRSNLDGEAIHPGKSKRLPTPVFTLMKLISVAKSEGGDTASILGNAEEILGSLGENYRIYWAGMGSFLWYVTALSLLMFFVLIMFSIFVYPQFRELYDNAQGTLPELTRITMNTLDTLRETFFVLMIVIVVGVIIIAYHIRTAMKALAPITGMITKLPGLGMLTRNYNSLLFINLSRLLATSGVSLDMALKRVWVLHDPDNDFDRMVSASEPRLHSLLHEHPVMASLLLSRQIGTLDSEIIYLSSQAEMIFSEQLAKLREEFTLIAQISVGVVIAILVISMYLPIFHMGSIF